tara:strand:+ start:1502 stop:2083 length:582 start_codon:yes stop_codon:yes gene_type:complete
VQSEPENEIPYEKWARAKYTEVQAQLNPCNENGELDPIRLNQVLTNFAQHFAWAVTIQEIESNKLNILQTEYDEWFKGRYRSADTSIREDSGGTAKPTINAIHSKISEQAEGEVERKQKGLANQRSRVDLLKGFVRVLDKQAGILQTLSSNMRSEMFFAGGVPIGRNATGEERVVKAKSLVRKAMKGQDPTGY